MSSNGICKISDVLSFFGFVSRPVSRASLGTYYRMFLAHIRRLGKSPSDIFEPKLLCYHNPNKQVKSMIAYVSRAYLVYLDDKGLLTRDKIIEVAFYSKRYNIKHQKIDMISESVDIEDLKIKLIIHNISEIDIIEPSLMPEKFDSNTLDIRYIKEIPQDWWDGKFKYESVMKMRIEALFGRIEDYESAEDAKAAFCSIQSAYIDNPSMFKRAVSLSREYSDISRCKKYTKDMNDLISYKEKTGCGEYRSMEILNRAKTFLAYSYDHTMRSLPEEIDDADIHLGLIINYEWIEKFIEHRRQRLGNYTSSMVYLLHEFAGHLNRETGWISLDVDNRYSSKVEYPNMTVGWEEYCMEIRKKILSYAKAIKKNAVNTRDSLKDAAPILKEDSPIRAVMNGLDISFEVLKESKFRDTKEVYLAKLGRHILVFMMLCFPLRAKHWTDIRFLGTAKDGMLFHKNNQPLFLRIPKEKFKNKHGLIMKDETDVEFVYSDLLDCRKHVDLLKEYIALLRQVFPTNVYLFPDSKGYKIKTNTAISEKVYQWSFNYLSNASPYTSRIIDLLPFRAHVMRAIVATDFCKRGLYSEAAALLCDTLETVLKHYAKITLTTRLKQITKRGSLVEDDPPIQLAS